MGKQVFIVTRGHYSDYGIEAVFTSEEKAKEYIRITAHNDQTWDSSVGYPHDYNIAVYELDKETPKMLEYVRYYATFINGVLEKRFSVHTIETPLPTIYRKYLPSRLDIEGTVKLRQNETFKEVRERAKKIAIDEYYEWKQANEIE